MTTYDLKNLLDLLQHADVSELHSLVDVDRLQPKPLRDSGEAVLTAHGLVEGHLGSDDEAAELVERLTLALERRQELAGRWWFMIGLQLGSWLDRPLGEANQKTRKAPSPAVLGDVIAAASEVTEDAAALDDLKAEDFAREAAAEGLTPEQLALRKLLDRSPWGETDQ